MFFTEKILSEYTILVKELLNERDCCVFRCLLSISKSVEHIRGSRCCWILSTDLLFQYHFTYCTPADLKQAGGLKF